MMKHLPSPQQWQFSNGGRNVGTAGGVEPGAACLVLERRTFQGQDVVPYARLTHPGSRHSMTERFSPQR